MKYLFYIFALLLIACTNQKPRKEKAIYSGLDLTAFERIKNSDSYLDYSEFIVNYPESKYVDKALEEYHMQWNSWYEHEDLPIIDCFRDCASIKIKTNKKIIYEHNEIDLCNLKDSLFIFFSNQELNNFHSRQGILEDFDGKERYFTKGHIQLQYVIDSCAILKPVLLEVSNAILKYKNYISDNWYSNSFDNLNKERREHLNYLIGARLILLGWDKEYIIPKPPPSSQATNNAP